jgi:hypothetical protein
VNIASRRMVFRTTTCTTGNCNALLLVQHETNISFNGDMDRRPAVRRECIGEADLAVVRERS